MDNIFQKAFTQGLQQDRPARDKLLFAIGTTAIVWYVLAILVLGLYPFTLAAWRAMPAKNKPKTAAAAATAATVTEDDVARLRESAEAKRAAANAPQATAQAKQEAADAEKAADMAEQAAGSEQPATPLDLWQFMAFSVTTIAGTLATFLGMVLGFGQVPAADRAGQNVPQTTPMQQAAAWAYFGSLVLALGLWALHTFLTWTGADISALDPAISRLGQSILGLFGGVLAVVLNVKS